MRLVVVTASFPHGGPEAFLAPELTELVRLGHDVTIVPVWPRGSVVHADAHELLPRSLVAPRWSRAIAAGAGAGVAANPVRAAGALAPLAGSRSPSILAKNLAVAPKALWLASKLRATGAEHVHAHWGGTSATVAMLAADAAGLPWSLTVHRWDIAEDNLLARKARSACFIRAISMRGAGEVEERTGVRARVLRLGVEIGDPPQPFEPPVRPLRIVTPANLVEVKGHRYLLEAARLLLDRGYDPRVDLAGDGQLRSGLERQVRELGLESAVRFLGRLSHPELLGGLRAGRWHVVALPSIVSSTAEQEGLPVSLVEALAAGVPAVATTTGGIPELLGGGAGLLVPPADGPALADALAAVIDDPDAAACRAATGRERVEREYDVAAVARTLVEWAAACG